MDSKPAAIPAPDCQKYMPAVAGRDENLAPQVASRAIHLTKPVAVADKH